MLFSSTVFVFCCLPLLLIICSLVKYEVKQYVLLFFSLFFYAWGEPRNLAIMLAVCFSSYILSLLLDSSHSPLRRKLWLFIAVVTDLSILGYYKYANFFIDNINSVLAKHIPAIDVIMPIGISFFTFQALSYVIDVYRKETEVQTSLIKLMLYISFFPQLIAGPIVKYHDIEKYLEDNRTKIDDVLYGLKRFIIGFGKKILIANPLGAIADAIFGNGYHSTDMGIAWLGAIAYSLQLFYDFSGYSDMAIGLGRMFGFRFMENFNYPYISKSITEFWRRWHISLGTWFRYYVYIPLGGNRSGMGRTCVNLFITFMVTGLWHGANWTFILWGIWHGIFVIVERLAGIKESKDNSFAWLRHIYALMAIVVGWTLFRADTISEGIGFLQVMFGLHHEEYIPFGLGYYLNGYNVFILAIALLLAMPIGRIVADSKFVSEKPCGILLRNIFLLATFVLSVAALASSTYNPFIYFRF